MIDLHLHTDASDGEHAPDVLMRLVRQAGIRALSVTDHDTVEATATVATIAARYDLDAVTGIEITAVHHEKDVHVLGYGFDAAAGTLGMFLRTQREDRIRRVVEMAERLAQLGVSIDERTLLAAARERPGRSVGRPQVARAMVQAGRVATVREAFDRFLATGRPGFVPRRGATPATVVALIRQAGGVASLAHPGLLGRDDLIPSLIEAGLGAIEVYHTEHDRSTRRHYLALARANDLAVTGGSDYHGPHVRTGPRLGRSTLPRAEYERLRARIDTHRQALAQGLGH